MSRYEWGLQLILLVFVLIQQGATKYPNGRIQFNLYVFKVEKWKIVFAQLNCVMHLLSSEVEGLI